MGVIHIKQIQEMVDQGETTEALSALENLLLIGPNNIAGLKLRAMLYEQEGRFKQEAEIWDKIVTVDNEDFDAINYLYRRQIEDREHFYFTDDLPEGGRRYLAYPRSLVNTSIIGLLGCIFFLVLSRTNTPIAQNPQLSLVAFGVLVMLPWLAIIFTWIKSIKHVCVNNKGISVATRLKELHFMWNDLDNVTLAHSHDPDNPRLALVLTPKDEDLPNIEIDLDSSRSAIRARSYLVKEISVIYHRFSYTHTSEIPERKKTLKY
jgi:tetratricopeptide (TPR) repeat protein